MIINEKWKGDLFNSFVQSIETAAIILFDEFEKTYDRDSQKDVLTLFDGVFPTKKLFIVTANKSYDISQYLINRPGRMYYNFKFDTLDEEFVKEYCEDRLINISRMDEIIKYVSIFSSFNFDMLASAVEEINRYDEPFSEVLNYLNIEPEMKDGETYELSLIIKERSYIIEQSYSLSGRGYYEGPRSINNFSYSIWLDNLPINITDEERDTFKKVAIAGQEHKNLDEDEIHIDFSSKNLDSFDQDSHTFIFREEKVGEIIDLQCKRNSPKIISKFDLF